MKQRYVVDLNVLYCAQTLTDAKGGKTLSALRFLTELVARCHSLVTSAELERSYSTVVDRLRKGTVQGPSVFALAGTALSVRDKWLHIREPATVKGEQGIPEDDRILVRVAVAARAPLVTDDGRLGDAIRETGILQRHGLAVLTVEEALALVIGEA